MQRAHLNGIDETIEKLRALRAKMEGDSKISHLDIDLLSSYTQILYEHIILLKQSCAQQMGSAIENETTDIDTVREKEIGIEFLETPQAIKDEVTKGIKENSNPPLSTEDSSQPEVDPLEEELEAQVIPNEEKEEIAEAPEKASGGQALTSNIENKVAETESGEAELEEIQEELVSSSTGSQLQKDAATLSKQESFYEEMAGQKQFISDELKNQSIGSLKKSIALNDRFEFIAELFKGDAEAFDASVNHIDGLESFQDAIQFVSGALAAKHSWNMEEKSLGQRFLKLVKRRFGR